MRLEWLDDLLAVAETGSFSEAAARRHLTQSAFSRRIRAIEGHLGVELFDRSRKPVQLQRTTAQQHDRILQLARMLRELVEDLRDGSRRSLNRLTLVSQHALTTGFVPALLQPVLTRHADLGVRLHSANSTGCLGLLLGRKAEIAIMYRIEQEPPTIEAEYLETLEIGSERLIPVHGTSEAVRLAVQLAAGELPVIAYPAEEFLGRAVERVILPRINPDLRLAPRIETALTLAAKELAAAGIGVAWVPDSLARDSIDGGRLVDASDALPTCRLAVVALRLRAEARPPAQRVWDDLVAQARQFAGSP